MGDGRWGNANPHSQYFPKGPAGPTAGSEGGESWSVETGYTLVWRVSNGVPEGSINRLSRERQIGTLEEMWVIADGTADTRARYADMGATVFLEYPAG